MFAHLAIYLVLYYLTEQLIKRLHKHAFPAIHAHLLHTGKHRAYFAFAMGIVISFVSFPVCTYASYVTYTNPEMDGDALWTTKTCASMRMALFLSELNRLDEFIIVMVHHSFSIGSLVFMYGYGMPLLIPVTIYASLVSEVPGDMLYILAVHSEKESRRASAWYKRMVTFNLVQYAGIRFVSVAAVWHIVFTYQGYVTLPGTLYYGGLVWLHMYTMYVCYYTYQQAKRVYAMQTPKQSQKGHVIMSK